MNFNWVIKHLKTIWLVYEVIKGDKVTDGCGLFSTENYNSGDLIRRLEDLSNKPWTLKYRGEAKEDKYGIYMNYSSLCCKIHHGYCKNILQRVITFNYKWKKPI